MRKSRTPSATDFEFLEDVMGDVSNGQRNPPFPMEQRRRRFSKQFQLAGAGGYSPPSQIVENDCKHCIIRSNRALCSSPVKQVARAFLTIQKGLPSTRRTAQSGNPGARFATLAHHVAGFAQVQLTWVGAVDRDGANRHPRSNARAACRRQDRPPSGGDGGRLTARSVTVSVTLDASLAFAQSCY